MIPILFSQTTEILDRALIIAQYSMKIAHADVRGKFGAYCSLESLVEATKEALYKNGLMVRYGSFIHENGMHFFSCTIKHPASNQFDSIVMPFVPDDGGVRSIIQGYGSSLTYLQRYTYRIITGVVTSKEEADVENDDVTPKNLKLSQEQIEKLTAIVNKNSRVPQDFMNQQLEYYKIKHISELTENQAKAIANYLTKPRENNEQK